jgi:hypothetical protein
MSANSGREESQKDGEGDINEDMEVDVDDRKEETEARGPENKTRRSEIEITKPQRKESRMKLRGTFYGTENETVAKAMIAKIRTKIALGEEQKGIFKDVIEACQGEATLWLSDWLDKNDGKASITDMVNDMERRFVKEVAQAEMVSMLKEMAQTETETIYSWRERVERIAKKAHIGLNEVVVKTAFIKGLRNEEARREVAKKAHRSWETIMTAAKEIDRQARNVAAIMKDTPKEESKATDAVAAVTPIGVDEEAIKRIVQGVLSERANETREAKERECAKCGKRNHSTAMCGKIKCYKCGQFGHVARDCSKSDRTGRDRLRKEEKSRRRYDFKKRNGGDYNRRSGKD